jgi:putative membrane protein
MRFDGIYGGAALLILATGLLKYFLFGKGISYYSHNYLMWIKLGMFTLVGLLSIYPTVYFLKWRKKIADKTAIIITDKEFKTISMCIHLELGIAIFIPLLATFLARGFGI